MANDDKSEKGARQLTPRQDAFAEHLLESDTVTEAARKAGYSDKNLAQSGHQALKAIRLKMPALMDELDLSERALIEKHLVPLLSATSTKFFQHEGKVLQKCEVADNDTRVKALDMAFKLRGSYNAADPKLNEPAKASPPVFIIDVPRPGGRPGNQVVNPQEPSRS